MRADRLWQPGIQTCGELLHAASQVGLASPNLSRPWCRSLPPIYSPSPGGRPSTLSYLIAAIRLSANHYVEVFFCGKAKQLDITRLF